MADITLCCNNKDCTLNKTCRRAITKPSEFQYYSYFKQDENEICDFYE